MKRMLCLLAVVLMTAGLTGCKSSLMGGNCGPMGCPSSDVITANGEMAQECPCGQQGCFGRCGRMFGGGHGGGHGMGNGGGICNRNQISGPPTAAVAYPYYTVRGPRDFLANNPPSIGR